MDWGKVIASVLGALGVVACLAVGTLIYLVFNCTDYGCGR